MIDLEQLQSLLTRGESVELEFKSDLRREFNDRAIYEEVVAMANTSGGVLLIGVEDDGRVTGSRPRHGNTTEILRLQSAIFHNTVPNVNTRISRIEHPDGTVLAIKVEPYPEPCATVSGRAVRRTVGPDGKPQTVPFYPRDQRSRRIDLGLLDFSAQVLEVAPSEVFDPLAVERLRQLIASLRGDHSLLELSDEELVKALRLVESRGGGLQATIAGLLVLGREERLLELLPTHELMFQVLDDSGEVRGNERLRWPLLRLLEELGARFTSRNAEQEIQVGLFRVPVPDYSPLGFREALNNALLHRDYTRLGAVHVQWHPDHLFISNPGCFPEGISVDNLLVHEPRPRNPRLAEVFNRVGLVEQTGRGVDRIYQGQLRYGRPAPDYSRTDMHGVRVVLYGGEPSRHFAALVFELEQQGAPLNLDELMVLNTLHFERRVDAESVGRMIQKGTPAGRAVLERLSERGFVEGRGEGRGRSYVMSAALYRRLELKAEYVRAKGFEPLQREQMVLSYAKEHGRITRSEAADLCKVSGPQASRLLAKLAAKHSRFRAVGERRGAHYVWDEDVCDSEHQ